MRWLFDDDLFGILHPQQSRTSSDDGVDDEIEEEPEEEEKICRWCKGSGKIKMLTTIEPCQECKPK